MARFGKSDHDQNLPMARLSYGKLANGKIGVFREKYLKNNSTLGFKGV